MKKHEIILASTSPRRVDLLRQAGVVARAMAPDVDESPLPRESATQMVARLARQKAESVAFQLFEKGGFKGTKVIIAADTTVVAPNGRVVLGKPEDRADAKRMLKLLQGKSHWVHTGYCILKLSPAKGRKGEFQTHIVVRVITSKVTMRKLGERAIDAYVRSEEPMDKAGAYAAQGLGGTLIESIHGSYSNVVGLPMSHLLQDLEERFEVATWTSAPRGRG